MSTSRIRPEISEILARLKARIQRYVFLEGTASVVALLGLFFWFSFGLDWSYFLLQRAELPLLVRIGVLLTAVSVVLCASVLWILVRCLRTFRDKALALVLERRFPELNDRLITAIELARVMPQVEAPLTEVMVQRTVNEVADVAHELQIGRVFDRRPLIRASLLALCLIVSVLGFAFRFDDLFQHWFNRNVLLANDVWKRDTAYRIVVLADPGEREVEFRKMSAPPVWRGAEGLPVYRHPKGGDLTLLVEVLPGKKVPDQVQLRYYQKGRRGGGRPYFAKLGERQFKITLAGLLDSIQFTVLAGDAERHELIIEAVDPPRIDRLTLDSLYPAYTQLNERDSKDRPLRVPVPVQGTQVSLPAGTDFQLAATTNKELIGIRIQTDQFDLHFDANAATLTLFPQEGAARTSGTFRINPKNRWLASDRRSFSVPFLLTSSEQVAPVTDAGQVLLPLHLPPDAMFRIFLSDVDDIRNGDPARLAVNSIPDAPPVIETRLRGIGSSITRKATIPIEGTVTDDYGVALARFDFKRDAAENFENRDLSRAAGGVKEFELKMSAAQPFERFEVLPLEMQAGQKLIVAIAASDGDDLNGPHTTVGERYTFQVVTDEELLSILYSRELNLRQRFEQILAEVKATRDDLTDHRGRLAEANQLRAKTPPAGNTKEVTEQLTAIDLAVNASSLRGLTGIRKNHNETQEIEQRFRDIREEMVNNAVDTPQTLARMDDNLLKPLKVINTADFTDVDQDLGLYQLALDESRQPLARLDESLADLNRLVTHMEEVLYQMRRLETFKELTELLKAIKLQSEELKAKTEAERKRKLIEALE